VLSVGIGATEALIVALPVIALLTVSVAVSV